MLQNNTNYLVEFGQTSAKSIMKEPQNYIGKLITEVDELGSQKNYLQFTHVKTGLMFKFNLRQVEPIPKVTLAFYDGIQPIIDSRVDKKCVAIGEHGPQKLPRITVEISSQDSEFEEQEEQISEDIQVRLRGWSSNDEVRNARMRELILISLQNSPDGIITPYQVRKELFRQGEQPTDKFVRENMESMCEFSLERTYRKYVLLEKYRFKTEKK